MKPNLSGTPTKKVAPSILVTALVALAAFSSFPAWAQGQIRAQGQAIQPEVPTVPNAPAPRAGRVNPTEEMRKIVQEVSRIGRRLNSNFIIVADGGLELFEREDPVDTTARVAAPNYLRALDGIVVRGLRFNPGEEDEPVPTDEKVLAEKLRLIDIGKRRGLKVMTVDYTPTKEQADPTIKENRSKDFVTFLNRTKGGFMFDRIPANPARPLAENPRNITGLNLVKNYLYLDDSSAYNSRDEFVIALSNTNYDAVIVDVLHRGREPFNRSHVRGMQFKKLGARRLALAYMNIGIAESYRFYWQQGWGEGNPSWISSPMRGNPDKYFVQYWSPAWKQLMFGGTSSYLYGIFAQGYDGVVLGGLDAYKFFESGQQ